MAARAYTQWMAVGVLFLGSAIALAADTDGDGVLDQVDVCCNTPLGIQVDAVGRPLGDLDFDCDVDLMDFAVMINNITGPLAPVNCVTCTDLIQNGSETDVDCGGGTCPPCANGLGCLVAVDCQSFVCQFGTCLAPSCSDGIENGNETDADCGGGTCPPCATGFGCLVAVDCQSFVCQFGACQAPSCSDGIDNGNETDVDCGGGTCPPCANGLDCFVDSDCQSGLCQGGICVVPLANGSACSFGAQCASGFCVDGLCCNTACAGLCQHCALTGLEGTCSFIPNGQDPDNECVGTEVCSGTGLCAP